LKIKKDADGMGQDFPNQAMVEVPEVVDANASYGKAFSQVRPHGFDFLAYPGTKLEQGRLVRRGHALTGRRHHEDPMPLGQQSKAKGIDEAFVSRDEARKAFDQVVQQAKVMGASRQQGKRGDHPPARDTQAQFEAVVVQLLGGAVPIVRKRFKAAVTPLDSAIQVMPRIW
jgi:hypothetical protein